MDSSASVRPGPRALVTGLLAALLVCGLVGIEWWPFTGWRLFSRVRTDSRVGWEVATVAPDGEETIVDPNDLPLGYRHVELLLARFPGYSSDEREEICEAIAGGVRDEGQEVASVRVYRVDESLRQTDGDVALERDPELRYECAEAGP
ncbi:MAG: hypothetical protein ACRDWD_03530 [Acidimicrobiia bacterium]